jgi:hypothetical protein
MITLLLRGVLKNRNMFNGMLIKGFQLLNILATFINKMFIFAMKAKRE